ncbi:CO(2)-response secreted protease-like [Zingiber officinale]|uniref:CO(2)-response secreted protease-like n=1 Tax=Zingiber officinale TaxID=94328 RepID=UPI001C4D379D|nr:CO(2)-response secreted protease-like [Zingiber officinale]
MQGSNRFPINRSPASSLVSPSSPLMANHLQLLFLVLTSLLAGVISKKAPEPYVVYMGGVLEGGDQEASQASHLQMLSSVLPSAEKGRVSLVQSYHHAFKGFSAMLTEEEAALLSDNKEVVSVFRDRTLQLHTTRSWDFLEAESGVGAERLQHKASNDVIIGIIDTGIWPESPSFSDAGMGEIPSRWKGTCMEATDFKRSDCNRKLIGARYYSGQAHTGAHSARDSVGHGTHTASTAAGSVVLNANYYGLAQGVAKGGSPSSRLAVYRACSLGGCASSAVLKAIDDAVHDGVDVISISIGMSSAFQTDFLSDPIAIGAFHANQRGVLVVCSAGNDGPDPYTVVNSAPWIFTVGASSIDRTFQSTILLGDGSTLKGSAINFSNHTRSESYSLMFAGDAAAEYTPVSEASNCYPGSIDERKASGKILVCVDTDPTLTRRVKKSVAEGAGAKGLILIDEEEKGVPFDSGSFPFAEVGSDVGLQILKYLNSTKKPSAVILASEEAKEIRPAPVVAYFSSRGPGGLTEAILKPDVMAPGVSIVAASIPISDTGTIPTGREPSKFAIKSGTSMACPHVAGAGAFVKSAHPRWSPSAIRSALMTTATVTNNLGRPLTNHKLASASFHDMGAGEMSPLRALSPGLVFDTAIDDYLLFLCRYGYKDQAVRSISGRSNFSCPYNAAASPDLISDINYPSISIAKLERKQTVSRTVTNVGPPNATYTAAVDAPAGVTVQVSPARLSFSRRGAKASYAVAFEARGASKGYGYGSITWSDGAHAVHTVFAVNCV